VEKRLLGVPEMAEYRRRAPSSRGRAGARGRCGSCPLRSPASALRPSWQAAPRRSARGAWPTLRLTAMAHSHSIRRPPPCPLDGARRACHRVRRRRLMRQPFGELDGPSRSWAPGPLDPAISPLDFLSCRIPSARVRLCSSALRFLLLLPVRLARLFTRQAPRPTPGQRMKRSTEEPLLVVDDLKSEGLDVPLWRLGRAPRSCAFR